MFDIFLFYMCVKLSLQVYVVYLESDGGCFLDFDDWVEWLKIKGNYDLQDMQVFIVEYSEVECGD